MPAPSVDRNKSPPRANVGRRLIRISPADGSSTAHATRRAFARGRACHAVAPCGHEASRAHVRLVVRRAPITGKAGVHAGAAPDPGILNEGLAVQRAQFLSDVDQWTGECDGPRVAENATARVGLLAN